jgi:hypothetical protein
MVEWWKLDPCSGLGVPEILGAYIARGTWIKLILPATPE